MPLYNSKLVRGVSTPGTSERLATEQTQSDISAKLDPATDIETQDLITVGLTPVEITFANTKGVVVLCAADTNLSNLFIGKSDVEYNGNKAFVVLSPGQTRAFTYDKSVNPLYVISNSSGQKLSASLKLDYGAVTFDGFDSRVVLNLLAINNYARGILGQFISPDYVIKKNIILTGGADFIVNNEAFGPHKVRKSSNEGTEQINGGGDWYGCSGRDLDSGGGVVSVDISEQNLEHQYRALESVKFIIRNDINTPETGVVKITVMGYDSQIGTYVPKAFTYLEINPNKMTDKDTYICGMTPTVITWHKDDPRYGFILFEDIGRTLVSRGTTIEVLLEDYSFDKAK